MARESSHFWKDVWNLCFTKKSINENQSKFNQKKLEQLIKFTPNRSILHPLEKLDMIKLKACTSRKHLWKAKFFFIKAKKFNSLSFLCIVQLFHSHFDSYFLNHFLCSTIKCWEFFFYSTASHTARETFDSGWFF